MSDSTFEGSRFSSSELRELEELIGVCAETIDDSNDLAFLRQRCDGNDETDYRIGNNVIKGLLGAGGQSMCFLAKDEILQRDVVVKLYRDGLNPIRKEQIVREGRALAKIDSPHVAKCYSTGNFDGRPYLVLEYVKGKTLEQWTQGEPVAADIAIGLIRQLANGVQAVHKKNLLHLDLKPGNIIIDKNNRPVMIDFGLSVSCFESVADRVEGTASFIAPERLLPELVDQRADIFGIGAVLYYLLCGRPPRDTSIQDCSTQEVARQPINFNALESSTSSVFAKEVCRRCLAWDPDDRFHSADKLSKLLDSTPHKQRILTATLTVMSIVALFVLGWFLLLPGSQESKLSFQNDFGLSYQIESSGRNEDVSWHQFQDGQLPSSKVFESDATYELKIKASKPSYISVFSLEYENDSSKINRIDRVFNDFTKLLPLGATYCKTIEPDTISPEGQMEFLWVMATSMPIDANSLAGRITKVLQSHDSSFVRSSNSQLEVVQAEMAKAVAELENQAEFADVRGVKKEPKLFQLSEGIIPYQVVE